MKLENELNKEISEQLDKFYKYSQAKPTSENLMLASYAKHVLDVLNSIKARRLKKYL